MKQGVRLIDNSIDEYQLGSILKELVADKAYTQISIATGYWDLPGMVEIFAELEKYLERENTTFRLLLGEEPSIKLFLAFAYFFSNSVHRHRKDYIHNMNLHKWVELRGFATIKSIGFNAFNY